MAKKQFQWVADGEPEEEESTRSWRRDSSRSARKRESDVLADLVGELLALQPSQWQDMGMESELLAALREGKRLLAKRSVRSGRRRHMLHIAALLRREEPETIETITALCSERGGPSPKEVALMEVELWRKRILAQGDRAIGELAELYPEADRQHLRQLARAAQQEQKKERPPRAFRQLFAAIRELMGV
jgi:ribosome-associated protein